jgi:hypothetical protein
MIFSDLCCGEARVAAVIKFLEGMYKRKRQVPDPVGGSGIPADFIKLLSIIAQPEG